MTANHVIKSTSMATYMGETMAWRRSSEQRRVEGLKSLDEQGLMNGRHNNITFINTTFLQRKLTKNNI